METGPAVILQRGKRERDPDHPSAFNARGALRKRFRYPWYVVLVDAFIRPVSTVHTEYGGIGAARQWCRENGYRVARVDR